MIFDKTGTLTVQTFTAGGALPLPESVVKIYGAVEENRFITYSVLTDINGLTEKISLPAPSASYSEAPNQAEIAYGLYNVEVTREAFYTKKFYNVAIFDGIDTFLPIHMVPEAVHDNNVTYPRDNLNTVVKENENLE